jgi:hypothetical protein
MKIQSVQRKLIIVGLLLVPFLSVGELFSLFYDGVISQSTNLTGSFKASKDIVFILLVSFGFFSYLLSNRLNKNVILYFIAVAFALIPPIILSLGNDLISILSGLRWLMPIILPVFIFRAVNSVFLQSFINYLCALLLLHFSVQIFQLFYASSWYGVSMYGFNLRNPGLFLIPNTGAFFSISALYVILFMGEMSDRRKVFFTMIGSASVFLTMSGSGFVALMIIIFFYYFNQIKLKFISLSLPFIVIFAYYFLESLLLRSGGNYIENSGGTRVDIMADSFFGADFISSSFGFGTNTFVMLGDGATLDSTYASFLVNLGYLGFLIFITMILIAVLHSIFTWNKLQFVFFIVFSSFAFTTIVYEVYPVNLIMAVVIAFFIKCPRKRALHQVNRYEISHESNNYK